MRINKSCLFVFNFFFLWTIVLRAEIPNGPKFFQHPLRKCKYLLLNDGIEKNIAHLPPTLRRYDVVRTWSAFLKRFTFDYASYGMIQNAIRGSEPDHRTAHFSTHKQGLGNPTITPTPERIKIDFSSKADPNKIVFEYFRAFKLTLSWGDASLHMDAQRIPLRALFHTLVAYGNMHGMENLPSFEIQVTTDSYKITFDGRNGRMFEILDIIRDETMDPQNIPDFFKKPILVDNKWFEYFYLLWASDVEIEQVNSKRINLGDIVTQRD